MRGRLQRKPIAAAKSILDQANPKPGKAEVWVVRGGEIAERGTRRRRFKRRGARLNFAKP